MPNPFLENKKNAEKDSISNASTLMDGTSDHASSIKPPPFQFKESNEKAGEQLNLDTNQKQHTGSPPNESNSKSFSNVNIIPDSTKASSMNAKAFTQGNDIHFAPGMYDNSSTEGKQLISHELEHVQQQRSGKVSPTKLVGGNAVNDDPTLENEADIAGAMIKHRLPDNMDATATSDSETVQKKGEASTDSGIFSNSSSDAIQCCAGEPPFAPPTGTKMTKLKGSYGDYNVEHGLNLVPAGGAAGNYLIEIKMTPNEDTAASKRIGFVQTVRRSPGPGKKWSTDAKDPGMSKERAARATKEGWRVDRGNAKKHKSPFYGTKKDGKGNLVNLSNSTFGKFGGAQARLWDRPAVQDPTALEFVATAMDPDQGIAYDAVHWGVSYDSSTKHYKEITPKIIPGNSKLLKSRDAAFEKWNQSDGKNKNIDKVIGFQPNVGTKNTKLNTKYGKFSIDHGLAKRPAAGVDGDYKLDIDMEPLKAAGNSRIGFVQTVRRSEGRGKAWATKAGDAGMSKERADRATKDGWRVNQDDAANKKTSFHGMQKQKNGHIKSTGANTLGKYKRNNATLHSAPAVSDPSALEYIATAMDINTGAQYGAIRWGFSYDSSTRQYTEITPTLINAGDPLLKERDEAFDKWNDVDAKKGKDTYKVPGT